MRRLFIFLFIGVFSLSMLASCSKTTSGNNGLLALLGGGSEPPVAGSFSKYVYGTGIGVSSTNILFNSTASEGRFMFLNLASDIKGAGVISSISFKFNGSHAAGATCDHVTIKMGHTGVSTLGTTYLNNVEATGGGRGTFTTVLADRTVTIPAGASGTYFTITLDTPFYYNGVDNLIIEVVRTAAATNDVEISAPPHLSGDIFMVYRTGAGSSANTTADTSTSMFPYTRLNFAGGDNRLHYGTDTNAVPFWSFADGRRVQMLYPASEINGSGGITGIGFAAGDTTTDQQYTITVRLGHNTSSTGLDFTLGTTTWNTNYNSGSPVTVAKAAMLTIPAGLPAGSYIWLPLSKAFNYNGTDNLLVEINVTSGSGTIDLQVGGSGTNTRLDGSADAPGVVSGTQYNVKFRFKDGTVDFFPAATTTEDSPFTDNSTGFQTLTMYRSCDLGTSGTITGMSLRLAGNAAAATYNNFSIVMGQTDSIAFSTSNTFMGSMDGATTVYSGNYTISSGSGNLAGDWVYIPFSTPFAVDPSKNLVIYYTTTSGTALNRTILSTSGTNLYDGMFAFSPDTTSTSPGSVSADIHAIRFTME